ncbi:hypothetical protein PVAND_017057 [Polypedilum vanderplanki]|uniref:Leucine-rich repeat protein n=1 Tax=Polypedilum vanderplanki TaxID=319348 RepID=A0A9J6BHH4_POLVA|nr:hypothetical protein PVAND_017057 [Polypedilum vanderplanki]
MKIFLLQIAALAFLQINSVNSAVLTCNSTTPPCVVSSITPVTSANEIITIAGQPSNYVDQTTTSLFFNEPNVLNFIPTNLFTIFPNLNKIFLTNVSLTNIVPNAFANCGNLMTIVIIKNYNFTTLPANFASTCVNVTNLQLGFNNIRSIDPDAFKGLTSLTYLNLVYNKLTCISTLFKNTPVIDSIDLSYNQISEIHVDTFKNLTSLAMISLMNNSIVNLPAFNLTGTSLTSSSQMFFFKNNPIASISPKFISNIFVDRPKTVMYIYLFTSGTNSTGTCIPNNPNFDSIYNSNWQTVNVTLKPCYDNWKDSYQTNLSCVSNNTVETTTKRTNVDNGNSSNSTLPFCGKNFFSIITNMVKNFTATVTFY